MERMEPDVLVIFACSNTMCNRGISFYKAKTEQADYHAY